MLRFPNPGSTIENFVRVYSAAFERLNGQVIDLDDLVRAVVADNLATSSGYIGDEAIARSRRADRSRDQLYNQLKMYAELFRTLGWLHPTQDKALNYTFTLLGKQIVAAGRDFWPLLEECVLGIVYPTPTITIKGDFDLRPFAFILRVMAACDGHLSRDEMIIGPLSAASDRGDDKLGAVVELIHSARASKISTEKYMAAVSQTRTIKINTLYNYTRWPIAILRDTGWVIQGRASFKDGRKYRTFRLSDTGHALVKRLEEAVDLRVSDLEKFTFEQLNALALVAHYRMLERAGFDITPILERIEEAEKIGSATIDIKDQYWDSLLFSPFQSISLTDIEKIFPYTEQKSNIEKDAPVATMLETLDGRDDRSHLFIPPKMVAIGESDSDGSDITRNELEILLKNFKKIEVAAALFAENHSKDTQTSFYPLVTHLFKILGFKSDYSRAGVNYQRWDACVWVGDYAIPVEIKSPTEEKMLSTKAVRQALENKVILLSRGGLDTQRELTSLVVGFRLPNERGEMSNLIDDVYNTYNLNLGVIDLTTLAHLALCAIRDKVTIHADQLSHLRGFLDV
ncbi:hypothetical protein [Pantoea stewartii]|uniref:hypothetical protein n=1 Tax=Pantoea stewartii TaxID=66269 RepID=UPI0021E86EC2|nr:hypothetical protein [Pantoea stewartii]UYK96138.1 hypothetical protein NG832_13170 [Pantoea stewartii]